MVFSVIALNAARGVASRQALRGFSTSAAVKKDIVQDAYLRELKAYKAPAKVGSPSIILSMLHLQFHY